MTAKPKSEMMARLREQRRAEGLVRVEVWAKPEHVAEIREFAEKIKKRRVPKARR